MTRIGLFAGTAMVALISNGVLAGSNPGVAPKVIAGQGIPSKGTTLYSQNSDYGYAIVSQNFTSGALTSYDAAAADDFVVPKGKVWKVTGVDVAGEYYYLSGPAASEIVTFYKNDNGHPGTIVGNPQTVNCTDTAGSFACTIKSVKFAGGKKGKRYWLSVVANCDHSTCGDWGWVQTITTHHAPGQWENPGSGFGQGCSSWSSTSSCWVEAGADDYAFDLKGKSD